MSSISEFLKNAKELKAEFEERSKAVFADVFKAFFAAHPEVKAIRWQQYTPGFNDGDPCCFTLTDPGVLLEGEEDEEAGEREDGYRQSYCLDKEKQKPLYDDLRSIGHILNKLETQCESTWGNDKEVTIYANGQSEIVDYDCGY